MVLKNYDPISYFEHLIDLYALLISRQIFRMRWSARTPFHAKIVNSLRIHEYGSMVASFRETVRMLKADPNMYRFHTGESRQLPDYYVKRYAEQLGRYVEIMPIEESAPIMDIEDAVQQIPDPDGQVRMGRRAAKSAAFEEQPLPVMAE
jgi:hypothetical protein